MVSNVLGIEPAELIAQLARLREDLAGNPDYQSLRADLPADWPL